jgi:hypothetical protein
MLSKMKRKTRERIYKIWTWFFLAFFVLSVAVAAVFLVMQPANPPGH